MKKVLLAALIFMATISSVSAIGLYFDAGIGVGPSWTLLDGDDFVDLATKSGKPDEMSLDLGLKLGAGPFDTIPIYVVGAFGNVGHRITYNNGYHQMNAFLLGPGIIFYPVPFVQVAGSLGYSFVANETSLNQTGVDDIESTSGFAGDISVAADVGAGNHALLLGLRFFGSATTLKDPWKTQNSIMVSMFIRYAFRHKK
jgi:hypothetical protein